MVITGLWLDLFEFKLRKWKVLKYINAAQNDFFIQWFPASLSRSVGDEQDQKRREGFWSVHTSGSFP